MDFIDFDIRKLDYFINKEMDELTVNKAKNPNTSNLLQYEFVKGLTWGDSRLKHITHSSNNDIKSPIFKTSSPLSNFNSKASQQDTSFNSFSSSFDKSFASPQNMNTGLYNGNELSYFSQSLETSPQPVQLLTKTSPGRCNESFISNDNNLNARYPILNTSNQLSNSFNHHGSSRDYNSANSSLQNNSLQNGSSLFNQSANAFNQLAWDSNQSGFGSRLVKRQVYQVAEDSSPILLFDAEMKETLGPGCMDKIWDKLEISSETIGMWTERLRKYLVQTIFVRVIEEINQINSLLISSGRDDIQIGETSFATLKLLCDSRSGQVFERLKEILPFIELHPNQKYLIDRIRALSFGCMSAYRWDVEGSTDIIKIDKNNPSDTMILMHFLCTYLDARLPKNCQIIDGKTFSKKHFVSFGEKIKVEDYTNSIAFIEDSLNPPHFNVISNGQIYLMKKGPRNVFQAILFFFYCIKISHQGMLRRISIGQNGLNLLWIFEENN